MKNIFLILLVIINFEHAFAATVVDLKCDKILIVEKSFFEKAKSLFSDDTKHIYEKIIIVKNLRSGHTKTSVKNGLNPPSIYYNPQLGTFISSSEKEDDYIALDYFVKGQLLLPECSGPVEVVQKAIVD